MQHILTPAFGHLSDYERIYAFLSKGRLQITSLFEYVRYLLHVPFVIKLQIDHHIATYHLIKTITSHNVL